MSQIELNHSNKRSGVLWRLFDYCSETFRQFLESTILNGLKYLTSNYLTTCEKLYFLCCLIAAFCNSIYFALTIVEKWQTSPTLTVMNHQTTYITDEPFPAVTICNMNQIQYSKVKDLDVKSLDYAILQKLCFQDLNFTSYAHLDTHSDTNYYMNFILKNAQTCSDMMVMCQYGNKRRHCTDLFRETTLDEGLCCTFNAAHPYMMHKGHYLLIRDYTTLDGLSIPIEWSPEKGYPVELPKSFYPRVALGDGISNGLTVILNGDLDNYYCSSSTGPGFKIAIHNPIDVPNIKTHGFTSHMGMETNYRITPSKDEATKDLQTSTKPKERQCYFTDEYSLLYFRYYTRSNCEMECDAKFLLRKCNCLPFYMPLVSSNATECHMRHFDCVSEAEMDYVDPLALECKMGCLPSCNELSYLTTPFFIPLNNEGFGIKSDILRNKSKERLKNYAVINIYFNENYYRGNFKISSMSLTECLSQVGGILSLMMGFSIIFLVEIAYFFVIKPLVNCWHKFTKTMLDFKKVKPFPNDLNQNPHHHGASPNNIFSRPHLPSYGQYSEQHHYVN